MKTVLITGCSSGYGLATARYFQTKGWNVIATMRTPNPELFPDTDNIKLVALDVTKEESIASALSICGPIDVLVNNAGIGLLGAFEATPVETIREVFETNTFGVMSMCKALIPQFRERRTGTIINVTSSVTLAPHPLVAVYTASKTAIEGFTTSLNNELTPFNINVKLVEPGYGPTTDFASNGQERMQGLIPEDYRTYASEVFSKFSQITEFTKESDVAEAVLRATDDRTGKLHFPAGSDAVALAILR